MTKDTADTADTTTNFSHLDQLSAEAVADFKQAARLRSDQQAGAEALASPLIIAEGDSWFDYLPGTDLIDCLVNLFHLNIENYGKAGDTLENMIFGTGITRHFQREVPQIYSILRRIEQVKPKVFLFSGGGNDVAGDEFASFLNHNLSGLPPFREEFASHLIQVVFRSYFVALIAEVAKYSPSTQIVVHGYGHTLPTGIGVDVLLFNFAGPWLRPALTQKAILDEAQQRDIVLLVINKYNEMLASLDVEYPNFHYVDLRPILDPHTDWVNELHLTNSAYARASQRIYEKLKPLLA